MRTRVTGKGVIYVVKCRLENPCLIRGKTLQLLKRYTSQLQAMKKKEREEEEKIIRLITKLTQLQLFNKKIIFILTCCYWRVMANLLACKAFISNRV